MPNDPQNQPKQIPLPVQRAQVALEALRAENAALAAAVQKLLPGFAMRLEKEGQEVTVEVLLSHARQGTDHLKAPRLVTEQKPLTYAEVVAQLPAMPEEDDDTQAEEALPSAEEMRCLLSEKNTDDQVLRHILMQAASSGRADIVQLMADGGVNYFRLQKALGRAVASGQIDVARLLLDRDIKVEIPGDPMLIAAREGQTEMIRFLKARGMGIDGRDEYVTPLMSAIMCGHVEAACWLINHGAAIDVARGPGKETALMWAAKGGHVNVVRLLLERGADIEAADTTDYGIGNMTALMKAAANGHTEVIRVLIDAGADIHKLSYEGRNALIYAVKAGQLEAARLLLERGADLHLKLAPHNLSVLEWVVSFRQHDMFRLLLDYGADVDEDISASLQDSPYSECGTFLEYAARCGWTDIVRVALERGARVNQTGDKKSALCLALEQGNADVIDLLLSHGADMHRPGEEIFSRARHAANSREVAPLFMEHVTGPEEIPADMRDYFVQAHRGWKDWCQVAGVKRVPMRFLDKEPSYFRERDFSALCDILEEERYAGWVNEMAYNAVALFGSEQRVLKYLQKWGEAGKQPLHDAVQMIKLPQGKFDIRTWGDAVMACGPGMARLVKFADSLPQPVKAADGKNWSMQKTREAVSQFAYERAPAFPQIAAFCMEHDLDEEDFEKVVALVHKQDKNIVKNLPEIVIDGKAFGMDNAVFHRLPANDLRGLVLGELTDCCQSIGGNGEDCAEHGFLSADGGFYVVEKNGEILAQAWAWRGEEGELVFDSLETLGQRVTPKQWMKLTKAFAQALEKDAGNVTAFHIGTGGKTPDLLIKAFNKASAKPKNYDGYRDSNEQVVVWKKHRP